MGDAAASSCRSSRRQKRGARGDRLLFLRSPPACGRTWTPTPVSERPAASRQPLPSSLARASARAPLSPLRPSSILAPPPTHSHPHPHPPSHPHPTDPAVGAGVLALPAATANAGFPPAAVTLTGAAAFSVLTGLLVAETCLRVAGETGAGSVSLEAASRRVLGDAGAAVFSAAFVFLHVTLLVAYVGRGGEILFSTAAPLLGSDLIDPSSPAAAPAVLALAAAYAAGMGTACCTLSDRDLDRLNSALVALCGISFFGLLCVALPDVDVGRLAAVPTQTAAAAAGVDADGLVLGVPDAEPFRGWNAVPDAVPIAVLAFVYHNVVPLIVASLEGDRARIAQAILLGNAAPWAFFLLWEIAVLGGPNASAAALAGTDPVAALSGPAAPLAAAFSFLALATSTVGFVLGLSDYVGSLADLPRSPETGRAGPSAHALALAPALAGAAAARADPGAFVRLLDAAGTYGVLVLFGVGPAALVWGARYGPAGGRSGGAGAGGGGEGDAGAGAPPPPRALRSVGDDDPTVDLPGVLVPGGRAVLAAVGGGAGLIILREAAQTVGLVADGVVVAGGGP